MANPRPGNRLTPEQKERICELRLDAVPVREVAATVGVAPNTVTKVFRDFLRERAEADPRGLEERRQRYIAELERQADHAARAVAAQLRESKGTPAALLMGERRQAIAQAAKLAGLDQPTKVEVSGSLMLDLSLLSDEELRKLAGEE